MSKSLARVTAALHAAGLPGRPVEMAAETRTAEQAAEAAGCALDQIVKSILFQGESGQLYLFLTAGGNQVDAARASAIAGEVLGRADADEVRRVTGFAIGGKRNQVSTAMKVVDVSKAGDWSSVKVESQPGSYGRVYPISGFVYPTPAG